MTAGRKKKSAVLFWVCVVTLIFTILLAIADATFRIAGWHFLILRNPNREFWLVWEVSAIASAVIGTVVYWLVQYAVQPRIHDLVNRGWVQGASPLVIVATLVLFYHAGRTAWDHGHLCTQLGFLCGGVFGFVVVQWMFLRDTGNPPPR